MGIDSLQNHSESTRLAPPPTGNPGSATAYIIVFSQALIHYIIYNIPVIFIMYHEACIAFAFYLLQLFSLALDAYKTWQEKKESVSDYRTCHVHTLTMHVHYSWLFIKIPGFNFNYYGVGLLDVHLECVVKTSITFYIMKCYSSYWQGSHFSGMKKFHDFSMIFPGVFTNFQV